MVNLFLSFFFFLLLPPSFKRSTIRLFLAKHVYVYVYMHVCALGTRTTSPPHNMEMAVELCRAVVVVHAPTPGPSNSTTSNIPDPLVLSSFPPRHLHSLPSHLFIRLHYYIIRANHNICIYNVQTTEFFFFFSSHFSFSLAHAHPLSKPIARRIDPLVVKSESTSQITRAISRNLKTENPSSYYYHSIEKSPFLLNIYIYL